MYTFNVDPIGKPRMTQRDKWKHRPVVDAYYSFKDIINTEARKHRFQIGNRIDVIFYLPMPQSWSKKKRDQFRGTPCANKPDTDNLLKAFCDALTDDDSKVWDMRGRKFWADEGHIKVIVNDFGLQGDIDHV